MTTSERDNMGHIPVIKFKLLSPHAKMPIYSHEGDALPDLTAVADAVLWPGAPQKLSLGFATEIEPGYYVDIKPRSGLSAEGIIVANSPGTIDANYRGEWKVILSNISNNPYHIHRGDRIAQMEVKEKKRFMAVRVDEISASDRGANGCGSTGK